MNRIISIEEIQTNGHTAGHSPAPSANGHAKPKAARKPRAKPAPKAETTATHAPASPDRSLHATATITVFTCAALSALLNAYSAAQHASIWWLGSLLGVAIPVIILLLGRVAGKLWLRGPSRRTLAYFVGGSGVGLLILSVYHCAESISMLTGSGLVLAVPMSVAIDCGLVSCELAAISES